MYSAGKPFVQVVNRLFGHYFPVITHSPHVGACVYNLVKCNKKRCDSPNMRRVRRDLLHEYIDIYFITVNYVVIVYRLNCWQFSYL